MVVVVSLDLCCVSLYLSHLSVYQEFQSLGGACKSAGGLEKIKIPGGT